MKRISLLFIVANILLFSCTSTPFTANFELHNDGVIQDSLLQLPIKIENKSDDSLVLIIEWRIATDNGETLKQMHFPYTVCNC